MFIQRTQQPSLAVFLKGVFLSWLAKKKKRQSDDEGAKNSAAGKKPAAAEQKKYLTASVFMVWRGSKKSAPAT